MFTVVMYEQRRGRLGARRFARKADALAFASEWSVRTDRWASVRNRNGNLVADTIGTVIVHAR
jgi:hypothetical protein